MYHSNENEKVIETETPRDHESGVRPNPHNCHNEGIEDAVDVYDARPARHGVRIVRRRPAFECLYAEVHDGDQDARSSLLERQSV